MPQRKLQKIMVTSVRKDKGKSTGQVPMTTRRPVPWRKELRD